MAGKRISPGRKGLYYLGMLVSLIGILLFGSVFLNGILHFGDFTDFQSRVRGEGLRAFFGIALLVAGGVLTRVGARGLAGSGILIDPEKAREEIQPWSRMAGGMAKDALDEAGLDLSALKGDTEMPFDEKLRRLHRLHVDGLLTEAEYAREKAELLEKN